MALASVSGRSRRVSRSARLIRPKASARPRQSKTEQDETDAATPDLGEVRQKRAAYYSRPAGEQQKLLSAPGVRPSAKTKTTAVATATSTSEHKKRRKHRDSPEQSHKPEVGSRSTRRTEDYVYGSITSVQDVLRPDSRRQYSHASPTGVREVPSLVEEEVTPDDSISQVGKRPGSAGSKSKNSRSLLQRNITTPGKLATIAEGAMTIPKTSPQKSHARDSSIFGSLLRRRSVKSVPSTRRLVECLTCGSDDVPSWRTAKLGCGHRMCHDCLRRIFDMSVKDPAHMPPRCCTKEYIPLKHVDKLFDTKFKVTWNRKYQEYHTKNRIYCPAPKCGEWIKPSHFHSYKGRRYAQCPRCSMKVCTQCNAKMHKSSDCPKDPEIAKLVEQAKEKGWQSCFNCHAMVELKEGCNHMTCRCLAEFCMICGSKWKTCDCPWFNYRDLPDPDRLAGMRVPEEIGIVFRRVMNAAGVPIPAPPQQQAPPVRNPQRVQPIYNDELEQRRRQERLDADLARRVQLGLLLDTEDEPRDRHREANVAVWGLENDGGHFLNDNFVQNAANIVMSAFGDAAMGRRGDRESGRRRPRRPQNTQADAGLVPNFLGDESVLGVEPSNRLRRR